MNDRAMRIRDAVLGDLFFNDWEEPFIRTPTFQRLHHIKQLGNAYHAYPTANHTRFEHSLGVCHQIKRLIANPGFFPRVLCIEAEEKRIIQLAGLLHDITHTPFKHTLDRDTSILKKEDRIKSYGEKIEHLKAENKNIPDILTEEREKLLLNILSTADPYDLPSPYQGLLIEDTISADLLDYTRRDAYFTLGGLRLWDDRIYDHIGVAEYQKKPCLVAKIVDENNKRTESAITEIVNLLYMRYVLNERVYFYHIKIAADALLAKSMRCMLLSQQIVFEKFEETYKDMTDEDLISYLISFDGNASLYAKALKRRELPKLAISFDLHQFSSHEKNRLNECCRGPNNLEQWDTAESMLAKKVGIDTGEILIYCHDINMQKKADPDFMVQDESNEPVPFSANMYLRSEIENIANKQSKLWRCYIFSMNRDKDVITKIQESAETILKHL